MKSPTIHLNGTSKESLLEGYDNAWTAVHEAYEVLKKTAPNGRDYYVQEDGSLDIAVEEHRHRLQVLHDVMNELGTIMQEIDSQ